MRKIAFLIALFFVMLPSLAIHTGSPVVLAASVSSASSEVSTTNSLFTPTTPGPWSNDCLGWAQMLGKEGKVADSRHMHALGCDDSGGAHGANKHYHATVGYGRADYCTKRARYYARWGYFTMPRTIMAYVIRDLPFCNAFEDDDWTYEALG